MRGTRHNSTYRNSDSDPKQTRFDAKPATPLSGSVDQLARCASSHADRLSSQDSLQLQRLVGNRATNRLLAQPAPSISQKAHGHTIQRTVDYSAMQEYPIFMSALGQFHALEQDDITPDEYALLKNQRQRFMPLLGRFATARATQLRLGTGVKSRTGDFAVTELWGVDREGKRYEYDKDKDRFHQLVSEKALVSFSIMVLFNRLRVTGAAQPGTMKSVGTILQAFTHEMSVHAENMLDFTEDYWAFVDGQGPLPAALRSASHEHADFTHGDVTRYQYMSARAQSLDEQTSADFRSRELNDKLTAK